MAWIDNKKAYNFVPTIQDSKLSKNVQDIQQSHKILYRSHEKLERRINKIKKTLTEGKIQRGIFRRDELSPLLFVIAMMPLTYILRKCTGSYKFAKSQEKINPLMYNDYMKLFAKTEKELKETQT